MYDVAALESAFAQSMYSGKFHYTAVTGSTNTDALAAAREGAQRRLMQALASQLNGRVEFHDADPGTEVRLVVEDLDVRD